jgi:Metallo-beta-lactamase superfamily
MAEQWKIGNFKITKIVELEGAGFGGMLMPSAKPDIVKNIPNLIESHTDGHGELKLSIHSFIVETPEMNILIDTCVGNHKNRPIPIWNNLNTDFIERMAAAGYPKSSIDKVICTHLHIDHVGWNTTLLCEFSCFQTRLIRA